MKILIAMAGLLAVPVAVQAQTTPAPAPVAPAAPATPAQAPNRLTLDNSIEVFAANPNGRAVLNEFFPDLLKHPSYEQFKGMTLKQLQPLSNGGITDADLVRVAERLAKL